MHDFNLNISTLSFKNKIYQTYFTLRALLHFKCLSYSKDIILSFARKNTLSSYKMNFLS